MNITHISEISRSGLRFAQLRVSIRNRDLLARRARLGSLSGFVRTLRRVSRGRTGQGRLRVGD
jgi:hypothetical protein